MKRALFILMPLFLFSCEHKPGTPEEFLSRLDKKIYYPQQKGLTSLECKVYSPYIDEMFTRLGSENESYKKVLERISLKVDFYWKSGYEPTFVISGLPEEIPALHNSVWNVFKGTDILIIPETIREQFADFELSMKKEQDKVIITGMNKDPKSDFKQYEILVDPGRWLILEQRFYGPNFISYTKPEFKVWKRKLYLTKIDTLQDNQENPDFKISVEINYQGIAGVWLVKSIIYQSELADTGERISGPVEILFDDCKVNQEISPENFDKAKVKFKDVKFFPSPNPTIPPSSPP